MPGFWKVLGQGRRELQLEGCSGRQQPRNPGPGTLESRDSGPAGSQEGVACPRAPGWGLVQLLMTACAKARGREGAGRSAKAPDKSVQGRGTFVEGPAVRPQGQHPPLKPKACDGDGEVGEGLGQSRGWGQNPLVPIGSTHARSPIHSLVTLLFQGRAGQRLLWLGMRDHLAPWDAAWLCPAQTFGAGWGRFLLEIRPGQASLAAACEDSCEHRAWLPGPGEASTSLMRIELQAPEDPRGLTHLKG